MKEYKKTLQEALWLSEKKGSVAVVQVLVAAGVVGYALFSRVGEIEIIFAAWALCCVFSLAGVIWSAVRRRLVWCAVDLAVLILGVLHLMLLGQ